jgi:hypothetical protein
MLIILGGLALIRLGARDCWRAFASIRWPVVSAVVLKSGVAHNVLKSNGTTRGAGNYFTRITVGYQVSGRGYTTDRVYFGQALNSTQPSEVALWVLRYPVGKRISVSHHPQDPSIAVLRPGFHGDVFELPGAGLALILVAATALAIYLASNREFPLPVLMLRLMSLLFLLLGIGLLTGAGVNLWRAYASKSWPVTQGVMISGSTELRAADITDGDDAKSSYYNVHLGYRYEVDDREYFSKICRFGQPSESSTQEIQELEQRYPAGSEVRVAYCPRDPELGVLELDVSSNVYWILGAGVCLVVFTLSGFVASFWI